MFVGVYVSGSGCLWSVHTQRKFDSLGVNSLEMVIYTLKDNCLSHLCFRDEVDAEIAVHPAVRSLMTYAHKESINSLRDGRVEDLHKSLYIRDLKRYEQIPDANSWLEHAPVNLAGMMFRRPLETV